MQVNRNVDAPAIRAEDDNVWEWLAKPRKKPAEIKDPQATFKPAINQLSKKKVRGHTGRD